MSGSSKYNAGWPEFVPKSGRHDCKMLIQKKLLNYSKVKYCRSCSTDLTVWSIHDECCHVRLVTVYEQCHESSLYGCGPFCKRRLRRHLTRILLLAHPACIDNGTNTPTATDPPNFGFSGSGKSVTGDYLIDLLIPNNVLNANSLSFLISGTQGGTTNTTAIGPIAATLFSTTAWTSGELDTYLGISASPADPIGAFLPSTQALDAGATGFFVYQADLGQNQLLKQANELSGPLLTLNNSLPIASYIVAFLNSGTTAPDWGTNANSAAIFVTGTPSVPEPSYALLLGAGIVMIGFARKVTAKLRA